MSSGGELIRIISGDGRESISDPVDADGIVVDVVNFVVNVQV